MTFALTPASPGRLVPALHTKRRYRIDRALIVW